MVLIPYLGGFHVLQLLVFHVRLLPVVASIVFSPSLHVLELLLPDAPVVFAVLEELQTLLVHFLFSLFGDFLLELESKLSVRLVLGLCGVLLDFDVLEAASQIRIVRWRRSLWKLAAKWLLMLWSTTFPSSSLRLRRRRRTEPIMERCNRIVDHLSDHGWLGLLL